MSEHEVWNELGNLYFLSGAYGKAVRAYNRAIELNPEVGEPCSNLALTYVQMGKYADATEFYKRGIRLLKDELDKAVSLHKLGDIYFHQKQFSQAAETYQRTEELVPEFGQIVESIEPLDLLLHCQPSEFHHKHLEAALIDELPAVPLPEAEAPPMLDDLTAWWLDGQPASEEVDGFEYDFGFVDEEGTHYVNNNVVYTEPLKWEVETFIRPELTDVNADTSTKENIEGVKTVADSVPNDVNMPNYMGAYSHQAQTKTEIQPEMQRQYIAEVATLVDESEVVTDSPESSAQNTTNIEAIRYDTSTNSPSVELSENERLEIQVDIDRFKQALETNPRNAYAWDVLGGHYKTLGLYDDAIDAYQKAVSIDSSQAFYFHHLALVYSAVGRHDDAIHAFERVIDVDPNHGLAHATLGGYYRKNGNEELAKVHIDKARNLLDNDENEYNRACMESICGNADGSLELLEIALKNKQTYVNWACKDPDLDFIRSDPRFQALLTEYAGKHV